MGVFFRMVCCLYMSMMSRINKVIECTIEAHNLYLEKLTRGLPFSSFSLSLLFFYLLLFLLLRPLKTPAHGSVKLC